MVNPKPDLPLEQLRWWVRNQLAQATEAEDELSECQPAEEFAADLAYAQGQQEAYRRVSRKLRELRNALDRPPPAEP